MALFQGSCYSMLNPLPPPPSSNTGLSGLLAYAQWKVLTWWSPVSCSNKNWSTPYPSKCIVLQSCISPAWEWSSMHTLSKRNNCSGYALSCAQSMLCCLHDHASYQHSHKFCLATKAVQIDFWEFYAVCKTHFESNEFISVSMTPGCTTGTISSGCLRCSS